MKRFFASLFFLAAVFFAVMFGASVNGTLADHEVSIDRLLAAVDSVQRMIGEVDQKVGATNIDNGVQTTVVALFETSLASAITSSATTMTLVSATDAAGTTLASSTYPFIIDEGTASQEMVIADCTGTTCTNITRGISPLTGTSTVSALRKSHRRGASVKITDGPQLMILSRMAYGIGVYPNIVFYGPNVSSTTLAAQSNGNAFANIDLVNYVGSTGCADASETVRGCGELATTLEAASSTSSGGSGARLLLPGSMATDTPSTVCNATPCLVMTKFGGRTISQLFLDIFGTANTFTAHNIFSSLFATNASTTNATSTNIWATGLTAGKLVKVSANKQLVDAVAGTDYPSAARISFAAAGPSASTGYATTTLVTIPAGTMTASSTIEINIDGHSLRNGASAAYSLRLADGTSILTDTSCSNGTNGDNVKCRSRWFLSFNSASSQAYTAQTHYYAAAGTVSAGGSTGTKSVDFTGAVTLYLEAEATAASNTMVVDNVDVQVRP